MSETYPRQTPRRRPPSRFFPVEAEEMLMSGDIEDATELCKHGLVYFPDNISGYAVLARAYLVLGEEDRAANVLEAGYRRTGAEGLRSLQPLIQGGNDQSEPEPVITPEEEQLEEVLTADLPGVPHFPEEKPAIPDVKVSPVAEQKGVPEKTAPYQPEVPAEEELLSEEQQEQDILLLPREEELDEAEEPELPTAEIGIPNAQPVSEESHIAPDTHFSGATEEHWTVNTTSASHEITVQTVSSEIPDMQEEAQEEPELVEEDPVTAVGVATPVEDFQSGASITFPDIPADSEENPEPSIDHSPDSLVSSDSSRFSETSAGTEPSVQSEQPDIPQESSGTETEPIAKPRPRKPSGQPGRGGLSIHTGTKISRLRSSNLRLIPGLEFAPLRRGEDLKIRIAPLVNEPPPDFNEIVEKSTGELPPVSLPVPESTEEQAQAAEELPPQEPTSERQEPGAYRPENLFEDSAQVSNLEEDSIFSLPLHRMQAEQEQSRMTPLEELARRLETARIPIVEEAEEEPELPAFEPSIVSDTFAGILAGQGAYAEAIKAYQMLARMKPERHDHYAQKIAEMRWKMSSVVDEREPESPDDTEE